MEVSVAIARSISLFLCLIFITACTGTPPTLPKTITDNPSVSSQTPSLTGEADIIFTNGTILTMDKANPIVEGIAIKGNKILAVGTNEEVFKQRGNNTLLVSLGGRTLMPGFVDTHSHIIYSSHNNGDFSKFQEMAIRGGITTETEMTVTPELMNQMLGYENAGLIRLRYNTYLAYNNACGEPFDRNWYKTYAQGENVSAHIRNQGVKVFSDGGACNVPAVTFEYPGGYGQGDLYMTPDQLTATVREIQATGHQVAVHALGDRAIQEAQNAIAAALNGAPNTYRHRIDHNAILHDNLLPRYNEVGIVPVIFGSYPTCWRINPTSRFKYVVPANLGTWEWPWRALLDANPGVKAAWHSDFPVFPDISPMAHLYGFVTRNQVAADGSICQAPDWLKAGAITADEALHIMTINSAYALFRDDEIGSLEAGKLADMVILSDNPLQVQPEAIKDINILMTMIDGKVEYCASGFEALCPSASASSTSATLIGFIDVPAAGDTVSGTIEIAGWALDEVKMDRVEIYLDGQYLGNAAYGNSRPDVDHDYPGRPGAPHFGYMYRLDSTSFSNGPHKIEAIAVNAAGVKQALTPDPLVFTIANSMATPAQNGRVMASTALPDSPALNAIDGNTETIWSSGAYAPQWIQIDLGKPTTVSVIRLITSQYPEGETIHQIWVGPDPNGLVLMHEFKGNTKDPDTLEFKPPSPLMNVRYIKILTTQSPSWVAWREVEIVTP